MRFVERLLQRMQLGGAGRHAFDRRDAPAVRLHGEHQARTHWLTVELHGARAAHAVLAPEMRPGEARVVADEVAEQQPRLDLAFDDASIYLDSDLSHAARLLARSTAFVSARSVMTCSSFTLYWLLPWRSLVGCRP